MYCIDYSVMHKTSDCPLRFTKVGDGCFCPLQLSDLCRGLPSGFLYVPGLFFIAGRSRSLFLGPLICRDFCASCLRMRILSSATYSPASYRRVAMKKTTLQKILKCIPKLRCDRILEVRMKDQSVARNHVVLPVPGCAHLEYKKEVEMKP